MEFKYDVFISYNWKDSSFVDSLKDFLTLNSIKCFLDKSELKIYDKLDSKLKKNVSQSKYLISIISQNYLSSYWCLFEAIEAIQNQDLNLKFLPVLLKYTPNDPTLDEELVFELIEDLSVEINSFERRIIKNRAYDLSAKLDKLNFIKNNLPKIFSQIQQNIYPVLNVYDEIDLPKRVSELVKYISPTSNPDKNQFKIIFQTSSSPQLNFQVPLLNKLPVIRWSTYIGKQKWKNTPVVIGNNIYLGSAGKDWNKPDDEDGIYCINGISGHIKWFHPTYSDVNEVVYSDGVVLGGCDDGKLLCVSAKNGKLKWEILLDSAILSRPIRDTDFIPQLDAFIVSTYNGNIYVVDVLNGEIKYQYTINQNILGNFTLARIDRRKYLFIPTKQGNIVRLDKQIGGSFKVAGSMRILYPNKYINDGLTESELYSTPIIEDNILYQGFARETYFDYPAIVAIDLSEGKVKWYANDKDSLSGNYGNIRTEILILGNEIVFVVPYSNELVGLDKKTGVVLWTTELGRPTFQQWSSPVFHNKNFYIARHDGYIYKVNKETHKREWGVYIGENQDAGGVFNFDQKQINEDDNSVWDLYKGFPILSTPSPIGKDLIISSDEGFVYRLTNI